MAHVTMADIGEELAEIFGENISYFSFALDFDNPGRVCVTIKKVITREEGEKFVEVLKKFAWKDE
jgi:hypothetical protein